jgi:hypothetical protein
MPPKATEKILLSSPLRPFSPDPFYLVPLLPNLTPLVPSITESLAKAFLIDFFCNCVTIENQ